ncbi:MAG: UDP-2,3-diacylglucosamine diphosphatase [Wenzhouxiangellaceae bacterium]|nr:UDP-2,3-diacylglucosamine diphosphatase [Wenzhouxiangellaceae bacterium]
MSDLHLGPSHPAITEQFLAWLAGPARQARRLLILGDLFETWIGDDADGALERTVAAALRDLADAGVETAFLHGNRDFLLGAAYCQRAGLRLLNQPLQLKLAGVETVLLHGDQLCTADRAYQAYRARVLNPDWQRRMLARPLFFRRSLARALRLASRLRNRKPDPVRADVTEDAVLDLFRKSGARRIIHGHTHRPGRHLHTIDGQTRERIVLGDWYEDGSVLALWPDRAELQTLKRG